MGMINLSPCPWCEKVPEAFPKCSDLGGDAWGEIRCVNSKCPAMPHVGDGIDIADNRGFQAYIDAAGIRWNSWVEKENLND